MSEPSPDEAGPDGLSAYDLLSKPTRDLTENEVEAIIVDLRKRRELYIKTGKPDRQPKPKAPSAKPTAADKAAATAALLASLDLKLPNGGKL